MLRRESVLFSPTQIGSLTVPNRFIASAVSFRDADQYGFPSQYELNHIKRLARGRTGLIIPGYMYTAKSARVHLWQNGMSSTCHADAWKDIIDEVHSYGSKIIFQIAHAGIAQASEHNSPKGVSELFEGTEALTMPEIAQLVKTYGKAAKLLKSAGADGIQLQCGNGFMLSQFLSPFTNKRHDMYGGSVQNRCRIVKEIINEIKRNTSEDFIIVSKINGSDQVKGGITPDIAAQNIQILAKEGVKLFEVTTGLIYPWAFAKINNKMLRGRLPLLYNQLIDKNKSEDFGKSIDIELIAKWKKMNPDVKFSLSRGPRDFNRMEETVKNESVDMISLGRPLLKEPYLVQKFYDGSSESDCDNCNQCYFNPPYMALHCPKSHPLPVE
ncbi:oxidoreductase, FAD/FMN-binding family protein [Tritrichomonas foetus]|uniref:Oxidoreductase, FAD/FMN-binding family protein n=1 Tax=Tritrichomonas foetus TaxID=1144522 RepID=A0A1J4JR47_9EUKA|nr:oxidoreductase, FAD/FMN-binding family protein [Tritrichomonas foetus]|eukprot:OHT01647.1 oxidoreductase, FAD/FMN-binding family protein [Tritrichomonas foetus]